MVDERVRILKKIQEEHALPALSPVAVQLLELASDDSVTVGRIASLIEQDPALVTRLLKLANSAQFSTRSSISTVSRAVTHLGLKRVRLMALSISLRHTFPLRSASAFEFSRFWRFSLYRAMIARELARMSAWLEVDPEEAFVAGLILRIGQLMLFQILPDAWVQGCPDMGSSLKDQVQWENRHLGINHREVGRIILKRWRFPEPLVKVLEADPDETLPSGGSPLCTVTQLAGKGGEILFGGGEHLYRFHGEVQDRLKLNAEQVNEILAGVFAQVDELAGAFDLQEGMGKDVLEVMEKANLALSRLNLHLEERVQWFLEHPPGSEVSEPDPALCPPDGGTEAALQAVAHEIRNPLTALSGFVQRLAKNSASEDQRKQYMKIILGEAARLERVLQEMNDYAKQYRPDFRENDLGQMLGAILERAHEWFKERNIYLRVHMDPDLPPRLVFDAKGIADVIQKILTNSARLMDGGGDVQISCSYDSAQRAVSLIIHDSGRPLPNEAMSELLDPIVLSKTFGTGLGIPMVRKIVGSHGGTITFTRSERGGNRAEIRLPAYTESYRRN